MPQVHEPKVDEPRADERPTEAPRAAEQPVTLLGEDHTGKSPQPTVSARILKVRAKLLNTMQTIGMGGTELLDSNRPEQNRAVEVWTVVPL